MWYSKRQDARTAFIHRITRHCYDLIQHNNSVNVSEENIDWRVVRVVMFELYPSPPTWTIQKTSWPLIQLNLPGAELCAALSNLNTHWNPFHSSQRSPLWSCPHWKDEQGSGSVHIFISYQWERDVVVNGQALPIVYTSSCFFVIYVYPARCCIREIETDGAV